MSCFFFSSRRRHTRFDCDWSSDVCSSDLLCPPTSPVGAHMPKLSCLLLTAALILPRPAFAQAEIVTPNDNLVTDGLPPVPAAIAAAARPYTEFRTAAFWDWHPTRREMIDRKSTRLNSSHSQISYAV